MTKIISSLILLVIASSILFGQVVFNPTGAGGGSGGGAVWGLISGTLSDQTDLQTALDAKAPSDATYITQTTNSGLSAEQALSTLSSGIMRVATTTGVITSLTDCSGIAANQSDETGTCGGIVLSNTPILITPVLGAATATSIQFGSGTVLSTFIQDSWTPTITGVTNVASSVSAIGYYTRLNGRVQGWSTFTITPTAAAPTATGFRLSLPVAADFGAATDGGIVCQNLTPNTNTPPAGLAATATDDFSLSFIANVINATSYTCQFGYRIP